MKMENFQADESYAIWYEIDKFYMLPLFSKGEIYTLEGLQTEGRWKRDRLPQEKQHTAHKHTRTYTHTYIHT